MNGISDTWKVQLVFCPLLVVRSLTRIGVVAASVLTGCMPCGCSSVADGTSELREGPGERDTGDLFGSVQLAKEIAWSARADRKAKLVAGATGLSSFNAEKLSSRLSQFVVVEGGSYYDFPKANRGSKPVSGCGAGKRSSLSQILPKCSESRSHQM